MNGRVSEENIFKDLIRIIVNDLQTMLTTEPILQDSALHYAQQT